MGLPDGDTKEEALRRVTDVLETSGTPYAVIGGVAVQLYSQEPRTTLDIDLAVTRFADIPRDALLGAGFEHDGRHEHSDNWRAPGPGSWSQRTAIQFSAEDVGTPLQPTEFSLTPAVKFCQKSVEVTARCKSARSRGSSSPFLPSSWWPLALHRAVTTYWPNPTRPAPVGRPAAQAGRALPARTVAGARRELGWTVAAAWTEVAGKRGAVRAALALVAPPVERAAALADRVGALAAQAAARVSAAAAVARAGAGPAAARARAEPRELQEATAAVGRAAWRA